MIMQVVWQKQCWGGLEALWLHSSWDGMHLLITQLLSQLKLFRKSHICLLIGHYLYLHWNSRAIRLTRHISNRFSLFSGESSHLTNNIHSNSHKSNCNSHKCHKNHCIILKIFNLNSHSLNSNNSRFTTITTNTSNKYKCNSNYNNNKAIK